MMNQDRLVGSPTIDPQKTLEQVLSMCADAGFDKFEAMTSWAKSALDIDTNPDDYRQLAGEKGLRFTSIHLPEVTDDLDASLTRAVHAARFARALGADVVIFKANSRDNYGRSAKAFLDAIEPLDLTAVITNHAHSPIATLDEYEEALTRIDDDRMRALLEIGHFNAVGVNWQTGYELLKGRVRACPYQGYARC